MFIKNAKIYAAITLFECFFVSCSLALTTSIDNQRILLLLYGGIPLLHISEQAAFLFTIILLQCYNANFVLYHLKNGDYLLIRYHVFLRYYGRLILQTVINTACFFFLSLIGAILALVLVRPIEFNYDFIELICIGLPILMAFAFAQILLLLFFKESDAFGILLIVTFLFAFLGRFNSVSISGYIPIILMKVLPLLFLLVCEVLSILIVLKRKLTL